MDVYSPPCGHGTLLTDAQWNRVYDAAFEAAADADAAAYDREMESRVDRARDRD